MFDDTWFMDLSKDAKIAWIYLITKCDHAGIIEINERLFKVQTGVNSWSTVHNELGNRLYNLRDMYFFIPKFIQFQYPGFPKSNVNQQTGAIKRLCEFGLFCDGQLIDIQQFNSSPTLTNGVTKTYGNVNGNDSIDKDSKLVTWRDSYEIYLQEGTKAFHDFWEDKELIAEQQDLFETLDIYKTINVASKYWLSKEAWMKKKSSKTKEINWKSTIENAIKMPFNKVYKPR